MVFKGKGNISFIVVLEAETWRYSAFREKRDIRKGWVGKLGAVLIEMVLRFKKLTLGPWAWV